MLVIHDAIRMRRWQDSVLDGLVTHVVPLYDLSLGYALSDVSSHHLLVFLGPVAQFEQLLILGEKPAHHSMVELPLNFL